MSEVLASVCQKDILKNAVSGIDSSKVFMYNVQYISNDIYYTLYVITDCLSTKNSRSIIYGMKINQEVQ